MVLLFKRRFRRLLLEKFSWQKIFSMICHCLSRGTTSVRKIFRFCLKSNPDLWHSISCAAATPRSLLFHASKEKLAFIPTPLQFKSSVEKLKLSPPFFFMERSFVGEVTPTIPWIKKRWTNNSKIDQSKNASKYLGNQVGHSQSQRCFAHN